MWIRTGARPLLTIHLIWESTTHPYRYQIIDDNPADEKGIEKKQVADLLDVNLRTVRRVTELEAETGSVVREPVLKGPRRLLNGIDCTVRHIYLVHHGVYILRSFQVSRVAAGENTGPLFA